MSMTLRCPCPCPCPCPCWMTIETVFPSHKLQYINPLHYTVMHRIASHDITSHQNTRQCHATQHNTIQYITIQYNTIQNNTILHHTVQHNATLYNLPNTDYRILPHRTAPRHRRLLYLSFYSTQHSASSPLNMHLLAPAPTLAPALGLLLAPVIRTSCSLHDGTRSILSSSSFFFFDTILCHTIPYHTIPYHTIPYDPSSSFA